MTLCCGQENRSVLSLDLVSDFAHLVNVELTRCCRSYE